MIGTFLSGLGVWLIAAQIVMRLIVSGDSAADGTNLFIHFMAFAAVGVILAERVLRREDSVTHSGLEIPLFIFLVLVLISPMIAVHKLPAVRQTVAFTAFAVLFVAVVCLRRDLAGVIARLMLPTALIIIVYSLLQIMLIFEMTRDVVAADPGVIGTDVRLLQEFAERLGSNEVFGTFTVSNTLAGFLALLLPLMIGMIIDLFREKRADGPARTTSGVRSDGHFAVGRATALLVLAALALLTLLLTGSLGGWVAFGVGMLFFAGVWVLHRVPRGTWIVLSACVVLIVAALLAAPKAMEASKSLRIRSVYWDGAVRVALEHPLTGVGLNNFSEYYFEAKGPEQEETIRVHNDFLQLWTELGVVGALAFLLFCGMLVIGGARRTGGYELSREDLMASSRRRLIGSAAAAAILLAFLLEGTFGDFEGGLWLALALAALWIGFDFLLGRTPLTIGFFSISGLLAGIVGFLVHMVVDFDLFVFGTGEAFFLMSAVFAVAIGGARPRFRLGMTSMAVVTAAVWLVLLFVGAFFYPGVVAGDRVLRRAEAAFNEAWMPGGNPAALKRAEEEYLRAIALKPMEIDAHVRLGMIYHARWELLSADRNRWKENLKQLEEWMVSAAMALENAVKINPRDAAVRAMLGEFHWSYSRFCNAIAQTEGGSTASLRAAEAREHLGRAERSLAEAARLYPTRAFFRERYGALLWAMGRQDEARIQFHAAIEYHERAKENGLPRLQLDPNALKAMKERL